jgi:hypothetical protein
MAEPTVQQMIEGYIKLRDRKAELDKEHKARLKPLNEMMDLLEGKLLTALDGSGMNSMGSTIGTVYKKVDTTLTVEDYATFEPWALDNWDKLDVKPNKTAIKQMLDEGAAPPPGVKITQLASVGVQRK